MGKWLQVATWHRVVQEVLTNILKYADTQQGDIDLIYDINEVQLFIVDDGKGFDVEQPRAGSIICN